MSKPSKPEMRVKARQPVIRRLNKHYFDLQETAARCEQVGRPEFGKRLVEMAVEIGRMSEVLEKIDKQKRLSKGEPVNE